MKTLLIVWHSQSGHTQALTNAALRGARRCPEVNTVCKRASVADAHDLIAADAILIGTPENFGTMSGGIKDFFDRTYYPVEGQMLGRAYAVFVSAGNDGTGAHRDIGRIATGYGWKKVHDGLIAHGDPTPEDLAACEELGEMMATGLSLGVF